MPRRDVSTHAAAFLRKCGASWAEFWGGAYHGILALALSAALWTTGFMTGAVVYHPAYAAFPSPTPSPLAALVLETVTPVPPTATQTATLTPTPSPTPTTTETPGITTGRQRECWQQLDSLSPRERWAAIISGEAGSFWADGMRIVAWTMEAQVKYDGLPAEHMGPQLGWYGCDDKFTDRALLIVDEVWDRWPTEAPYDFMHRGERCVHLGSLQDAEWWRKTGLVSGDPDLVLTLFKGYSLVCFFSRFPRGG